MVTYNIKYTEDGERKIITNLKGFDTTWGIIRSLELNGCTEITYCEEE